MHGRVFQRQGMSSIRYTLHRRYGICELRPCMRFGWMGLGLVENSFELSPPVGRGPVLLLVEEQFPEVL